MQKFDRPALDNIILLLYIIPYNNQTMEALMTGFRKDIFDLHPHIDENSPMPLHTQLSDSIMRELRQRNAGAGIILPPILTLATALQLNRDTVRKAYATLESERVIMRTPGGRTFTVSPEFAESLSRRQLMTIGIVLPDRMEELLQFSHQPALEVVAGIMDTAADSGIAGMIVPLPEHDDELQRLSGWVEQMVGRLDGLIYLGESSGHCHDNAFELLLSHTDIPQIFISGYNRFREHLGLVQVDLQSGFSQALDYLQKRNFTSFAVAANGIPVRKNFQLQTMTRFEIMKELAQANPPEWSIITPDNDLIMEHFHKVLRQSVRPQAVFCSDWRIGEAVHLAASSLKIRVPDDLEIICYGKVYENKCFSEIRHPYFESGCAAVNMITAGCRNSVPVNQMDTLIPTVFHPAEK